MYIYIYICIYIFVYIYVYMSIPSLVVDSILGNSQWNHLDAQGKRIRCYAVTAGIRPKNARDVSA